MGGEVFGEAKACWELHGFLWQVPRDKDHEFEVTEEPVSTQALVLSWGVRAPHNVDIWSEAVRCTREMDPPRYDFALMLLL